MPLFNKKFVANEISLVKSDEQQLTDSSTSSARDTGSNRTVATSSIENETIPSKRNFSQQCCSRENLKEQALLIATIAAVLVGVGVGIALRTLKCDTGKEKLNFSIDYSSIILL